MSKEKTSSGITTLGLLGVCFVVLKLTNYIDWSWWWVTIPFWGGLAIGLVFVLIYLVSLLFVFFKKDKTNVMMPKYENPPKAPKSRFEQRLDNAMKEQQKRRNV